MSNSPSARSDARGAEPAVGCWQVPASIMALIRESYPKDGYALAVCFGYLMRLAATESPDEPYGATLLVTARGVGAALGCDPRVARDLLDRLGKLGVLHELDRDHRRAKSKRGNRTCWLSRPEDALIAKCGASGDPQRKLFNATDERGTVCARGSAFCEPGEAAEHYAEAEPGAHTVPFGGKGVIAPAPESSFSSDTGGPDSKKRAGAACEQVAQQPEPRAKRQRSKPVTIDDINVPAELDTPKGRAAIVEWLEYKRAKRQSYKRACDVELLLSEFVPHGPDVLDAAVKRARGNNWASIAPDMIKSFAKQGPTRKRACTYEPNAKSDF